MRFVDPGTALPAGTSTWPNSEDVLAHAASVHALPAIALQFPKWTDGRAYSQAVLLRLRLRYRGELIATGEVLADMLPLLRRCGFSAVQLRADQSLQTAQRALGWFDTGIGGTYSQHSQGTPGHYQTAAADRVSALRQEG